MTKLPSREALRKAWMRLAQQRAARLSKIRIWHLALLYLAVILGIIALIDTTKRLGLLGSVYDIRYADKLAHFTLYGVLSLLANLTVFEARPSSNPVPRAIVCTSILAVVIGLEELSQLWLPLRKASPTDLASSLLGVAVFAYLAVRAWKGRSLTTPQSREDQG